MSAARHLAALACAALVQAAGLAGARPAHAAEAGEQPGPSGGWQRELLDRYCVTCHNGRMRTAGLALDEHDVGAVAAAPAVWETVVRKLRAGAMPPAPRPRPDAETYDRFVGWLEAELDRHAAANPDPGRTEAFHRLNRTEYHHAVRDLLDLEMDVAELLPADGASYGFDNIAGVLGVSPTLLERYLAARRARSPAWRSGAPPPRPPPRCSASRATCRRTTGWRACRSAPAAAARSATRFRRTPSTTSASASPATPATTSPSSRCRTRWR